jgi:hypothetical protein
MARLLTLVWLSWQLLLTAAAPSLAAVTWPLRSESVLPENDPFYTEPPGLRSIKAGTILRYRPVPNPITLDNKNAIFPKHAWQILYRTQNSIGKPSATVTTLFAPRGAGKGHLFTLNYFSVSPVPAVGLGNCTNSVARIQHTVGTFGSWCSFPLFSVCCAAIEQMSSSWPP